MGILNKEPHPGLVLQEKINSMHMSRSELAASEFSGRKTAPSGALENANPDVGKQQSGFAETP